MYKERPQLIKTSHKKFGNKCCCCFVLYQENRKENATQSCSFVLRSEPTPRLKALNCIPCFPECVQDAYMEEEGPRGDMTIQSRLSNSTESIDSMKALTAAIEAANAQVSFFSSACPQDPKENRKYSTRPWIPDSLPLVCRFTDQPVSTSVAAPWLSAPPNRQCWAGGRWWKTTRTITEKKHSGRANVSP